MQKKKPTRKSQAVKTQKMPALTDPLLEKFSHEIIEATMLARALDKALSNAVKRMAHPQQEPADFEAYRADFEAYRAEMEETKKRLARTQQEIDQLGEQTRQVLARLRAA